MKLVLRPGIFAHACFRKYARFRRYEHIGSFAQDMSNTIGLKRKMLRWSISNGSGVFSDQS